MSARMPIHEQTLPHVAVAEETGSAAPVAQSRHQRSRGRTNFDRRLMEGTYMSSSEDRRADAFVRGFRVVCQHPREIGLLEPDQLLVMDLNVGLFNDKDEAIRVALDTAARGVPVGIYTYHLGDPDLDVLRTEPNIVLAKTDRQVWTELRRRLK